MTPVVRGVGSSAPPAVGFCFSVLMGEWRRSVGLAMTLALAWGGTGQAAAVGAHQASATSAASSTADILIVGDSITQASVGDYSWRYFAWKHLEAAGANVDFVGPKRDLAVPAGSKWRARYNDSSFDQDHAATWGDRIAFQPYHDRAGLMTKYRPDVVVLALGANDLGWMEMAPHDVILWTRTWIVGARQIVPDVDIVLMDVPWTDDADAQTYNALLDGLATELDNSRARVVVAAAADGYRMGRKDGTGDTYDALHPNTHGQVKIAAAVADALAGLGIGRRYARPLSIPAEGPRARPVLKGRSSETSARWRWSVPPGATSFDVYLRRQGKAWVRAERAQTGKSYRMKKPKRCEANTLRVRARKGWTLAGSDVASRTLTLRVGPEVSGRAKLRGVESRARAVAVSWRAKKGACSYVVRAVGQKEGRTVVTRDVVTAAKRRTVIRGLTAGKMVRIQVRAVGARNATAWSKARTVRPR